MANAAKTEKVNSDGMTFKEWKAQCNAAVVRLCGMSLYDLTDHPMWDYWNDGVTPADAAREWVAEEAEEMGFDPEEIIGG